MQAMQIVIRPLGGDIANAEGRITETAEALAGRGLVQASCLVNEDLRQLAPFFVWRNGRSLRTFLFDDHFRDVVDGIDRPRLRTWTILSYDLGPEVAIPHYAVREIDAIDDESLAVVAKREAERHRALIRTPGLFSRAVMLDPARWEIGRLTLWRSSEYAIESDSDCVEAYRVDHVCGQGIGTA